MHPRPSPHRVLGAQEAHPHLLNTWETRASAGSHHGGTHGHVSQWLSGWLETANVCSFHEQVLNPCMCRALCQAGCPGSQGPGLRELAF